jgi:hypothetical protein
MIYKPAMIGLCRGSTPIDAAIRVGETTPADHGQPSIYSHAFIVTKGGTVNQSLIVEAQTRGTVETRLSNYARALDTGTIIYDPVFLDDYLRDTVAAKAITMIGTPYGFLSIMADAADWCVSWFGNNRQPFANKVPAGQRLVCSVVVARAFQAVNYRFLGKSPDLVQPDDIGDDVSANILQWDAVKCL